MVVGHRIRKRMELLKQLQKYYESFRGDASDTISYTHHNAKFLNIVDTRGTFLFITSCFAALFLGFAKKRQGGTV